MAKTRYFSIIFPFSRWLKLNRCRPRAFREGFGGGIGEITPNALAWSSKNAANGEIRRFCVKKKHPPHQALRVREKKEKPKNAVFARKIVPGVRGWSWKSENETWRRAGSVLRHPKSPKTPILLILGQNGPRGLSFSFVTQDRGEENPAGA